MLRGVVVDVGAALGRYGTAVGQNVALVIEGNDAIAEQAPALLRVGRDHVGRVAVTRVCGWTGWAVLAHLRVFQIERSEGGRLAPT